MSFNSHDFRTSLQQRGVPSVGIGKKTVCVWGGGVGVAGNMKIEGARGMMGRSKRDPLSSFTYLVPGLCVLSFYLFPFPCPNENERGLCGEESYVNVFSMTPMLFLLCSLKKLKCIQTYLSCFQSRTQNLQTRGRQLHMVLTWWIAK